MCDTDSQRRCATCAVQHGRFADVFRGLHDLLRGDHEAPGADGRRRVCAGVFQLRHNQRGIFAAHLMQVWHGDAQTRRRGVHCEVQARFDDRRRNQRHDRHEGFHQHRAVTDKARVGFVGHQLRRGAGGDQRVEARHGTTGDGDKQEREQRAFPQWAGAVNVLSHRRHFELRVDDHNPDSQPDDNPDFQEGREVITWCQNQPYREQGGYKRITNQREGDGGVLKGQRRAPVRVMRNDAAKVDRGNQQHDTNHGDFAHAPRAQEAHVNAHEQRNRYGRADGKHALSRRSAPAPRG